MSKIVDFFSGWAEAIGGVFSSYPLSGALITLVAIGVFLHLEGWRRPSGGSRTLIHAFVVLLGWLVAVPILGLVFNVIGGVWDGVLFFYSKFEQQPIFVLVVLALSFIAYPVWGRVARDRAPQPAVRILLLLLLFLLIVAIVVPVINAVS